MSSDAIDRIAAAFQAARPPSLPATDRKRELKCPVCGEGMRVERVEGVATDVCTSHGLWLDLGEMDRILAHIRAGHRFATSQAVREAERNGKLSGMFFGALSLLWRDE